MYQNTVLKNHIEQSSSINVQSLILAEWNLNFADNVKTVGNYRWRNGDTTYGTIASSYTVEDETTTNPKYYGALTSYNTPFRSDVTDESSLFYYKNDNEKEKILFSLTDCLGRFRPRSGINKIRYPIKDEKIYLTYPNESMHLFPRYYLASKDDKFKYWSSYRTEPATTNNIAIIRGISILSAGTNLGYYIYDANPFVVYDRPVPANRIVVKMQTNVTTVSDTIQNTTNSSQASVSTTNPFYENPTATATVNQTTPLKWNIEYLDSAGNWQIAKSFNKDSRRSDNTRVIGADGYVEIAFGISNIPATYTNSFFVMGSYTTSSSLPPFANKGDAYLVGATSSTIGQFYVWNGSGWDNFIPTYGWVLADETITANTTRMTNLVSPDYYSGTTIYDKLYREFQFIYGIRIKVETMAKQYAKFDLIEMSPRLVVDLSDKTLSYSLTKVASDIGNTGMPVGQLLTSNGSIDIFDYDQAFNQNNTKSILNMLASDTTTILSSFITKNLQFKFYEIIKGVSDGTNINNYYVPIKTMYADGFPQITNTDRKVSINLRNLYFYLESLIAPSMLYRNITVSMAVSLLLDSVGFSNYKFDRIAGNLNDKDDVIPFFYIAPDTSVAQVLNDLAISTQTAIFFNEYNDLVFMSRNRMLPGSTTEKATDITLYGTKDFFVNGAIKNNTQSGQPLSNIINIASQSNDVFNAGKITYVNRYIQKSILKLSQAYQLNNSRDYYYKPVLLWEASGTENTMANNDDPRNQSGFSLSAAVLNAEIPDKDPTVNATTKAIDDNIIELSPNSYLSRYKGYLYSNGEIIKYDAIQYAIPFANITGLIGTTANDSNSITMAYGTTTYSLSVGQVITVSGGSPGFTSATITGIQSSTTFTISVNASSATTINFSSSFSDSNVWISSLQEYQNYFSKLSYGGQIYPTGKVRIYAEPYYESDGITYKTGKVAKHGRAQFGTKRTSHNAKLNSTIWSNSNIKNVYMESSYIFNDPYFGTVVKYTSASTGSPTTKITTTQSTSAIQVGWYVSGTNIVSGTKVKTIVSDTVFTIDTSPTSSFSAQALTINSAPTTITSVQKTGKAGLNTNSDNTANISSVIRDKFSSSFASEISLNSSIVDTTPPAGTVRSSALILKGADAINSRTQPLDYISYILKDLKDEPEKTNFSHYGTRMRIIGQQAINNSYQTPVGSQQITTKNGKTFSGASGGMCFRVDQTTNNNIGYYFEIAALNQNSVVVSGETVTINNVYFYKIVKKTGSGDTDKAIPILLWSGLANINVDSGDFVATQRLAKQTDTTSYDLAVETKIINSSEELFYLYINDTCVAAVSDTNPIALTTANNTIGMFTRGTSKVMFENIYAIGLKSSNYGSITDRTITPLSTIDNTQLFPNGSFSKYGISSSISNTYLRGLSSADIPQCSLWIDEFGTIMREAAYLNVRYDKAYPAITAKVAPTYNVFQSYAISGFNANAYNAEFLIINTSDSMISLDEQSSNYLRIYGVAPTQQSSYDLTVDEYFSKNSDFSNPQLSDYGAVLSPSSALKQYANIQNSRITYGRKEFTIAGPYLQSESAAKKLMEWMVKKNMTKQSRRSVGVQIFANPMIQLGDIVEINYVDTDSINQISYSNTRFVVYNIEYKRDPNGPTMTLYLSEVS